jgi:hypothetical protein
MAHQPPKVNMPLLDLIVLPKCLSRYHCPIKHPSEDWKDSKKMRLYDQWISFIGCSVANGF